jgi:hypothetical protein
MSPMTTKITPLIVGLLVAAGAASPAVAAGQGTPNGVPALSVPASGTPALPGMSQLPILGDQNSGELKCALIAFSLGPLYFLGPFGPLGPWGPLGPLHGDPEHPCFGGLDKK